MTFKRIGVVKNIYIYPLKSGKYIELKKAECTERGLSQNNGTFTLLDRQFVIHRKDNGEKVTARTYHQILQIRVESRIKGEVIFKFPDTEDLVVNITSLNEHKGKVRLWGADEAASVDCGDEASLWLGKIIYKEKDGPEIRLAMWIKDPERDITKAFPEMTQAFPRLSADDSGAFADLASYMLMTTSSVKDLQNKLESTIISEKQFRPNIFVETDVEAFDEDLWALVKIGDVVLESVKPCTRCMLTTINPETSERNKNGEPLKTLKKYRQIQDEEKKKVVGNSPVMGINLGLREGKNGLIKVGDPVYVTY